MPESKADLIRLLEAELDFIEGGGYGQPAGQPLHERPVFFHTPVCINSWQVPGHEAECHDGCVLLDVVPERRRDENLPCHYIPLNEKGDTIKSLEEKGDRERLEETVKQWLRTTIARLKRGEDALGQVKASY